MMQILSRTASVLWAIALWVTPAPTSAHPLAPSLLEVRELPSGLVSVLWKTPLLRPRGSAVEPVLPEHCRPVSEPYSSRSKVSAVRELVIDCRPQGLVGAVLRVAGLRESRTDVLVRVALREGRIVREILHRERDSLVVPERKTLAEVAASYVRLGLDHIRTGVDHLLFVLVLVLLVSGRRMLLLTITAFTLGHSVTLSLAVLGFVRFPTAPIEFAIAFSILWIALELTRSRDEVSADRALPPWAMALGFGLLHGFGFAGAMTNAGLPPEDIPLALLSFNAGIELGQALFVGGIIACRQTLRPLRAFLPRWGDQLVAYAIGSVAAFWCLQRAALPF